MIPCKILKWHFKFRKDLQQQVINVSLFIYYYNFNVPIRNKSDVKYHKIGIVGWIYEKLGRFGL